MVLHVPPPRQPRPLRFVYPPLHLGAKHFYLYFYLFIYKPHGPGLAWPNLPPSYAIRNNYKCVCPTPLRRLLLRLPGHKTWPGCAMPPPPTTGYARLHWETMRQKAIVDATAAAQRLGVPLPNWKALTS